MELVALGVKPRRFGKLHHRVAYVFITSSRVVVVWKDDYHAAVMSMPNGRSTR